MTLKTCLYCPTQFDASTGNGRQLVCKEHKKHHAKEIRRKCYEKNKEQYKARARAWALANPDKRKKQGREFYDRNALQIKERIRLRHQSNPALGRGRAMKYKLKAHYGMTVEDYTSLFSEQEGKCAVCREAFDNRPNVDHCHTTGAVRGLLCRSCNTGLGMFKDSTERLQQAILYLSASQKAAHVSQTNQKVG